MITSIDNRQVKNVTALIKKAKERHAQHAFVAEGPKMCLEAPADWVKAIYVSEGFCKQEAQMAQLEEYLAAEERLRGVCEVVSDAVFGAMSDTRTPQGILAVVRMPEYELEELLRRERAMFLVLEGIQDPGNLGTMLRTGEGAGVTGVIADKETADLFNPKTIRATMGSVYRVPFVTTPKLGDALWRMKNAGVRLYAAHLNGKAAYDEPDYTESCGFLIGNEGSGLREETARFADGCIRIPMEGNVESLNAAVSASLLMYECSRQRRGKHADLV